MQPREPSLEPPLLPDDWTLLPPAALPPTQSGSSLALCQPPLCALLPLQITVVEAHELLGSFDARLREYAARKLVRAGVHLTRGVVKEVRHHELELQDGNVIPFGLCVWSTGVGPTDFTLSLPFVKTGKGRVAVDSYLRVLAPPKVDQAGHVRGPEEHGSGPQQLRHVSMVQEEAPGAAEREAHALHNVYALGDCCAGGETALPALAQVRARPRAAAAQRTGCHATVP